MALDIGKLVGYIELDASGAVKGIQQTNQAIATGSRQWQATAGKAGEAAGREGGTRMAKGLNDTVGKIPSHLKTAFVSFGAGIVGALGVNAVVDYARDAINAASDLEQSIGGVEAVFGRYADEVKAKSEQAAQSLGLSKNAYNELITVSAALLKNKGLETFAQDADNLVRIGADLAAQYGGPTRQAVEALNAAMRGESDPIERYGISLNETAVNAKLAEMGLKGLEGKALELAKTQARLQIITEQSADAHGAFAREADTAAGKAQRQQARLENLQAAIGERLMPVYQAWLDFMGTHGIPALEGFSDGLLTVLESLGEVVGVGQDAVRFFQELPAPIQAVVGALAAIQIAKITGLVNVLSGVKAGVATTWRNVGDSVRIAGMYARDAGGGWTGLAAGVKTFTGAAGPGVGAAQRLAGAGKAILGMFGGPWGLAIAGAATAVGFFVSKQQDAERQVDELRDSLDEQTGALTENSEAWFKKKLQEDGVYDAADRLGISLSLLTQAAMGEKDALEELNGVLDSHRRGVEALQGTAYNELTESQRQLVNDFGKVDDAVTGSNETLARAREELDQLNRASGEAGSGQLDLAGKIGQAKDALFNAAQEAVPPYTEELEDLETAAKDAAKEHDELVDSLLRIVDNAVNAEQAAIDYQESLDNLTESIKENGKTHDISTEKGRNNQEALLAVAEAAKEEAAANLANGDSLFQVQQNMDKAREAFINGARQMGYTKEEAEELADRLGLTDEHVNTLSASIERIPSKHVNVTVGGVSAAIQNVQTLTRTINGVQGKEVTVVVNWAERGRRPGRYLDRVGVWTGGYMRDVIGLADGGWPRRSGLIVGPGGPTDDLVPARLSTSEFVTRAAAVQKAGLDVMYAINSGRFDRDNLRAAVGLAGGGTPAGGPAAPAAGGGSGGLSDRDITRLAGALAAAVDSRPVRVGVNVDSREIGRAAVKGRQALGPRVFETRPRLGRRGQ